MELLVADKTLVFDRLKQSLQLLAAPSDIQLRVVPALGYRAPELYLSFDHWRMKVLANFLSELEADQLSCLESLQAMFVVMGPECWTDSGVAQSAEWKDVRHLSSRALQAFGWAAYAAKNSW